MNEIIFTNIESITFNGIDIYGVIVPTKKIIDSILNTIPDLEGKLLFACASNACVKTHEMIFNPHKYLSVSEAIIVKELNLEKKIAKNAIKQIKLRSRLIEIDKIQADITGFDFVSVIWAKAVMSWHETVRGNYTGTDNQKLRKATSRRIKALKGLVNPSSVKFPTPKDYSHLIRAGEQLTHDEYFPCYEYLTASNYIKKFCNAVDDLSITNSDIRELEFEIADIYRQIATISEADPMSLRWLFCCPFCGKRNLVEEGKTPKSCGSPECDRAYSAATTKESSNQPYALNKKSSLPPKAFDGKAKICTGCGKKKVIYQWVVGKLCKPCGEGVS